MTKVFGGCLGLWSLIAAIAQTTHAAPPRKWQESAFAAMSTRLTVMVPPEANGPAAFELVAATFDAVEAEMSEWRAGSPLARLNQAAGTAPVVVPPELLGLIGRAVELGATTHGAFDLTWAALWPLWQFPRSGRGADGELLHPPRSAAIESALRLIDYRRVVVDRARGTVYLPQAGMKVGLGGIAKGWALDRAAAGLRALGLSDFLLDAGGQVMAIGRRDGHPWRVGLRQPRGGLDDRFGQLEVSGQSVSTSGDYEHFFVAAGVRYHHIIDPRSGWPSRGLMCATAIATDATLADGLSTAFMVLGVERALALVAELRASGSAVDAVLVDDRGGVHMSPDLAGRFRQTSPVQVRP